MVLNVAWLLAGIHRTIQTQPWSLAMPRRIGADGNGLSGEYACCWWSGAENVVIRKPSQRARTISQTACRLCIISTWADDEHRVRRQELSPSGWSKLQQRRQVGWSPMCFRERDCAFDIERRVVMYSKPRAESSVEPKIPKTEKPLAYLEFCKQWAAPSPTPLLLP